MEEENRLEVQQPELPKKKRGNPCGRLCDHLHVRPPHTARGLPFVICWVDPTW